MEELIKELIALGTLLGGIYVVIDSIYYIFEFFPCSPDDISRLKFDVYSIEAHKKNILYSTLAFSFTIFLALQLLINNYMLSLLITIILMLFYTYLIHQLEKKRKEKILTIIDDNGIIWSFLFRTEEGYYFRREKTSNVLNKDDKEFMYFKTEDLFKKKLIYTARK